MGKGCKGGGLRGGSPDQNECRVSEEPDEVKIKNQIRQKGLNSFQPHFTTNIELIAGIPTYKL